MDELSAAPDAGPGTGRSVDRLGNIPEPDGIPPRIAVVINPISRVSRGAVEQTLRRRAPIGTEIVILETKLGESVRGLLGDAIDGAGMVVAVGGDGTVSDVATALLGTDVPLGIIPSGTTNMVAKVNRVPGDLDGAVSLLFGGGRIECIDVGRCDGKSLLHIGGSGIDAHIFARSNQSLKRTFGWLAYAPPAIPSLRLPASVFRVTVDGETVEVRSRLVLVANSGSLVSTRFNLFPHVSRTDGVFNVLIFTADGPLPILESMASLLTLGRRRSRYLIELAGRDISIDADPPMPFEIDGDLAGTTPFHVVVEPSALRVICGPRRPDSRSVGIYR